MRWTVAVLGVCFLQACAPPPSPADAFSSSQEDLDRGRSIFIGTCAGYCHSPTSERDAPLLFDCTTVHGAEDQAVFDVIASGVPNTRMIGFGDKLPEGDDDIWRLVAYISSERPSC